MRVDNNSSSRKISFSADFKPVSVEKGLEKLCARLSKFAQNIPESEGDLFLMETEQKTFENFANPYSFIKFSHCKKGSESPVGSVRFPFEIKRDNYISPNNELLDRKEYENYIEKAFKNFTKIFA